MYLHPHPHLHLHLPMPIVHIPTPYECYEYEYVYLCLVYIGYSAVYVLVVRVTTYLNAEIVNFSAILLCSTSYPTPILYVHVYIYNIYNIRIFDDLRLRERSKTAISIKSRYLLLFCRLFEKFGKGRWLVFGIFKRRTREMAVLRVNESER